MKNVRSFPFTLQLSATQSSLEEGLRKVRNYCTIADFENDVISRLLVVIEELATNTIKYGYGGECGERIEVTLSLGLEPQEDTLILVYEDYAAAFNPLTWEQRQSPDELLLQSLGERGIFLVRGLVQSAGYTRVNDANRTTMCFAATAR